MLRAKFSAYEVNLTQTDQIVRVAGKQAHTQKEFLGNKSTVVVYHFKMNHLHIGNGGGGIGLGANFAPHQHQSSAMGAVMGGGAIPANMPPSTVGVTIRLHGLPLTASSADIRKFFSGS